VTNLESGSWSPSLTDYSTGQAYSDTTFPGVATVAGRTVSITVSLDALGTPEHLRLSAVTQRADNETGGVIAEDELTEGAQGSPMGQWLSLPAA
jgi:hypothetical protein